MQSATSLRTRAAAHTAADARRLGRSLGITAVTDITRLDKLGLPVAVSLRPGGLTAQVHAGKGMTALDARVGAWMEAIETAVAEQASTRVRYVHLPLAALQTQLPHALALADFAPRLDAVFDAGRPMAGVCCVDLLTGRQVLLPAELALVPGPDDEWPPLFGWSTNGLASGNTLQEATLHALLEVLERDTIAMSMTRADAAFVDAHSLPAPWLRRMRRWRGLGVRLLVRHLPGDFDLPCVEATLHEPGNQQVEVARGWGLHVDRRVALARAVCEAAQVRLCRLHSEQPDMAALYATRLHRDTPASAQARRWFIDEADRAGTGIDFQRLPHHPQPSVPGALAALLARLQQQGCQHVFRRRMPVARRDGGAPPALHVVKVIVPRCENLLGHGCRAGPRLRQQMAAAAAAAAAAA